MEISKALQEEILSVQNKLKNAIRDHQICVVKLKDDPNNTDILDRIREIQLHIVSLGRWQKQVVQRLRKEVESYKAENALNGARVSVASLLGLGNNNNHMTNNNELGQQRRGSVERSGQASAKSNGLNGRSESRGSSKEDYEEIVRNGDVASPLRNACKNERRSSSVEPASGADEDVVEVRSSRASPESRRREVIEVEAEDKKPSGARAQQQVSFLGCLGLITSARLLELQKKRSERKRRSTAGSHFVYSNWEVPMKRKRHAYLQSLGNAPQTRQTTARLNGPSPPPAAPVRNSVGRPPSAKTRSLMQAKAAAAAAAALQSSKPNILRNGDGKQPKQEFYAAGKLIKQEEKPIKLEEGTKLVSQSTGKTVHIPGLPSGLTIERIENDSTVCIACRNPGTLTVCEYCSAKFHVSCHTISPASTCYCPKCAARFRSKGLTSTDLEILRHEMKSVKKEKDTEERERVRYELRERNADLRMQVYELEKRSQLISQSLQLQHRTRRELLGKQETTRRSIKRLVDFIKLMQLRPRASSSSPPRPSVSTSCPPRPSSYPSAPPLPLPPSSRRFSPRPTISPSLPSTSRTSPQPDWDQLQPQLPQRHDSATALPSNQSSSRSSSPRSSLVSFHSRASPQPAVSQSCCDKLTRRASPTVSRSSSSRKSQDNLKDKEDGTRTEYRVKPSRQFRCLSSASQVGSPDHSRSPSPTRTMLPSRSSATTMMKTSRPSSPVKTRPTASISPNAHLEHQTSLSWDPHHREPTPSRKSESPKCITSPLEAQKFSLLTHPDQLQQLSISRLQSNQSDLQRQPSTSKLQLSQSDPRPSNAAVSNVSTSVTLTSCSPSSLAGMATKSTSSTSSPLVPNHNLTVQREVELSSPTSSSSDT